MKKRVFMALYWGKVVQRPFSGFFTAGEQSTLARARVWCLNMVIIDRKVEYEAKEGGFEGALY